MHGKMPRQADIASEPTARAYDLLVPPDLFILGGQRSPHPPRRRCGKEVRLCIIVCTICLRVLIGMYARNDRRTRAWT
jgi:hypothetical protein